ncbi:hypothetical protein FF36_05347 [Frankia torreyi]|uniref:Uncharacterized protein n=1 Tax=Frankia torreyi TaxID=1856 RepID=A0A0D8B7W9_9ACTN|nr:hypothetical protein FF36_05347 [Frankia torreyi]KQM02723.1 hypothetical protein FF86_105715 [Frankia sp. CpI1-P]
MSRRDRPQNAEAAGVATPAAANIQALTKDLSFEDTVYAPRRAA